MAQYDLSHLTQPDHQDVGGPIQDDEALFLYSIIRGSRIQRILEVGGGAEGYSAKNFLQALNYAGSNGILYTCDVIPVDRRADNHKVIVKDIINLNKKDVDDKPLDMIFFDCHNISQLVAYFTLKECGVLTDDTILAIHDTNLHFDPFRRCGFFVKEEEGYAHQPVERMMVNKFKEFGYDIFSIKTTKERHSKELPLRHGITICQKFKKLHDPS